LHINRTVASHVKKSKSKETIPFHIAFMMPDKESSPFVEFAKNTDTISIKTPEGIAAFQPDAAGWAATRTACTEQLGIRTMAKAVYDREYRSLWIGFSNCATPTNTALS
jgi:hypothetical protein